MPWKECHVMAERLRFVVRLLEGENMAPLCAAVEISRKSGYKIFERYKDCGVAAFTDRSRRPYRQANRSPPQLEAVIVRLKREYPVAQLIDVRPIRDRAGSSVFVVSDSMPCRAPAPDSPFANARRAGGQCRRRRHRAAPVLESP